MKLLRLNLVSELLLDPQTNEEVRVEYYNCGFMCTLNTCRVEKRITDVIEEFSKIYFNTPGRITADTIKRRVFELVGKWETKAVLTKLHCQNLRFMFTRQYYLEMFHTEAAFEDPTSAVEDIDGELIEFFNDPNLIDEDLDGEPINL